MAQCSPPINSRKSLQHSKQWKKEKLQAYRIANIRSCNLYEILKYEPCESKGHAKSVIWTHFSEDSIEKKKKSNVKTAKKQR